MPDCSRDAIVIGAGLAGSAVAHVLAQRGLRVLVLEQRPRIADAASGNPAGVLIPYLTKGQTPELGFYERAWDRTISWRLLEEARIGRRGALHLAHNTAMQDRFAVLQGRGLSPDLARSVTRDEASELAGVSLLHGGLYYPDGGLVSPRLLCRRCLEHPAIRVRCHERVVDAGWIAAKRLWRLRTRDGKQYEAPYLVLASAHEARQLGITSWLPVYPVRGQILFLEREQSLRELQLPVSYDGYATPLLPEGLQILGASFEHWNREPRLDPDQNEAILGLAARVLPEFQRKGLAVRSNRGRVAFRSTSTDRFPLLGPLPDWELLSRGLADRRTRHLWSLRWPWELNLPQVYLSLAHASRGILSAYHSAEVIAELIEQGKGNTASRHGLTPGPLWAGRFLRRRFRKTGKLSEKSAIPYRQ